MSVPLVGGLVRAPAPLLRAIRSSRIASTAPVCDFGVPVPYPGRRLSKRIDVAGLPERQAIVEIRMRHEREHQCWLVLERGIEPYGYSETATAASHGARIFPA